MALPPSSEVQILTAPTFYLTVREPLRPAAILIAILTALVALSAVLFALGAASPTHRRQESSHTARSADTTPTKKEEEDDPTQVDTIVLGDPSEAPTPARTGDYISPVHPTILVHLPHDGDLIGLIPNTPAGHLLYAWLAAFNRPSWSALASALPTQVPALTAAAQAELRQQTGGFNLLSAKEVQPGILVFRLRDQTSSATEALGTLQVLPDSNPATIANFSLRAIPTDRPPTN